MFRIRNFLILICILFLFTRLYRINEIPPSVYWDEASIGYNAYSISQTSRDEWGEFLPIHFRAFGEFKLPVYIYSVVPFVKIFGLNALSVRLPSILFSLGVVILTYFLAKKLSENSRVGLLSSFIISISPWFFIFSRTGYEATAGLMFYLLAILLILHKPQGKILILSLLSFILSAYSYNSFRVIIPITFLVFIAYNFNNLWKSFKKDILFIVLSLIILTISIIPIYRLYRYDAGISRLQAVGITNSAFIQNYLSHFSPDFLFIRGDKNIRSQQSGFGELYLPELILIPLGLFYLLKSNLKNRFLIITLILLGPIPAAITKETPHALRSISMAPLLSIVSAFGVFQLWSLIKKRKFINLVVVIIFLILFAAYFIRFINSYSMVVSKDWQYGYKKIFTDYRNDFDKYDRVIISDEYAQPYIFTLFYLKIDPDKFRKSVVRNSVDQWGFSTVSSFEKFEFGKINELINKGSEKTLIFASPKELISDLNSSEMVYFLDKEIAFRVYRLQ